MHSQGVSATPAAHGSSSSKYTQALDLVTVAVAEQVRRRESDDISPTNNIEVTAAPSVAVNATNSADETTNSSNVMAIAVTPETVKDEAVDDVIAVEPAADIATTDTLSHTNNNAKADEPASNESRASVQVIDLPESETSSPVDAEDKPSMTLDRDEELPKFKRAKAALAVIAPRSPFIPGTLTQWMFHRASVMEMQAQMYLTKLIEEVKALAYPTEPIPPLISSTTTDGSRGGVLSQSTIWCANPYKDGPGAAPWPSQKELEWEGDARAKTKVGRFFPLPRHTGNPTVAWHMLPLVPVREFDQTQRVPTVEDMEWAKVVNDDMDEKMVNSDLWKAINDLVGD